MLLLGGCGLTRDPEPEFPLQFELPMGASRRVPYAASLWFASVEEAWDAQRNAIVPAVRAEMYCKGKTYPLMLQPDTPSAPVCGVQVRLLAIMEPGRGNNPSRVFRAHFSIAKAP
jgi:hypothetical protein